MADGLTSDRFVLVTGATGRQGAAVVRHLLHRGFGVRALTRQAQKPAARALGEHGAEVMQGDLVHAASVASALQGVDGVFSVQNF